MVHSGIPELGTCFCYFELIRRDTWDTPEMRGPGETWVDSHFFILNLFQANTQDLPGRRGSIWWPFHVYLYSQASTAWTQASYGHWVSGVGGHGDHLIDDRGSKEVGEVYSVLTWKDGGAAGFWSRAGFRRMHWGWARWTRDQIADRAQSYRPFVATCVRITEQSLWKLIFFSNNFGVAGSGDEIFIL